MQAWLRYVSAVLLAFCLKTIYSLEAKVNWSRLNLTKIKVLGSQFMLGKEKALQAPQTALAKPLKRRSLQLKT